MKNLLSALILLLANSLFAQGVDDSTSMEMFYAKQVYYSYENGEVSTIDNEDWNIAFSLSGEGAFGSSILLNEATSQLWAVPNDTSFWETFDTIGQTEWNELLNSDTSWTNGAFNAYRGAASFFDMGWGILDPSASYWTFGDSLYLIKLGDDSYKKLWIESLKTGVWSFKYANIDGSDEVTTTIEKADYTNKNFIYVSLETNEIIDREPDNTTWDILFSKHRDEVVPNVFVGVTSVFNNVGIWTARADKDDLTAALSATSPETDFTKNVVNIGRTWKKFSSGAWTVYDSIAYFSWNVDSSALYRIVFTDFGGMTTGKSFFNIHKLGVADIHENVNLEHLIYPNPSTENITVVLPNSTNEITIFNLFNFNGDLVFKTEIKSSSEIISVNELPAGVYLYQLINNSENSTGKLIVQ